MTVSRVANLDKLVLHHADIQPHIQGLAERGATHVSLGQSSEGREISALSIGQGDKRILAWSQMHGDESTATAALMDLATYLLAEKPGWLEQLTLMLVPMLNPDGAQRASRFNAHGIDINRDALALQSPEGRILHNIVSEFSPHWAFNLHDQDRWYRAGPDGLPATLSFLASSADPQRSITPSRQRAMGLIGQMVEGVSKAHDIGIGRYSDDFNGRCFGDAIAGKGIPLILVESGHKDGDPARQTARELNSQLLLKAFELISTDQVSEQTDTYQAIPLNVSNGCADLVVTGVKVSGDTRADVVIRGDKVDPHNHHRYIDELGDYAYLHAYESIEASGLEIIPSLTYWVEQPLFLDDATYRELIEMGYLRFAGDAELLDVATFWPIDWRPNRIEPDTQLKRGDKATFALGHGDHIQLAVICGQAIQLVP